MRSIYRACWFAVLACGVAWAANPVPYINSPFVPDTAAPGGSGFTLTVNGTGFVSGAVLKFNGQSRATKFVSEGQVKANILASDIALAHTAIVTVQNPGSEPSNVVPFPVADPVANFKMHGQRFSTAGPGAGLVTGDFNGDGNVDIAVVAGKAVSVLLGNGDGTFQPHVDYPLPKQAFGLACADFNHDGNLDLAVTDTGGFSILLGKSDGTFETGGSFFTQAFPVTIIAGDFNGDGNMDLATTYGSTVSELAVRLGDGRGGFGPSVLTPLGQCCSLLAIAAGDFNGDGKLDLVAAEAGNIYLVLLGKGDGTFQVRSNTLTACLAGIGTADFNGDGILDLAVTYGCSLMPGYVSIMLGDGHGNFSLLQDYKTSGQSPSSVALGDFNNDGFIDLLISNYEGVSGVSLGNGDGTFQNVLNFPEDLYGYPIVAAADVNNDGELDIIAGEDAHGTHEVAVLLQQR